MPEIGLFVDEGGPWHRMPAEPMPGWYQVSGGRSLHRIYDGGWGRMRTACGLGIRAVFGTRSTGYRRCLSCQKLERKQTSTQHLK